MGSGGVGELQIRECQVFLWRKKEAGLPGRDKEQTRMEQEFPIHWVFVYQAEGFARLLEGRGNTAVV